MRLKKVILHNFRSFVDGELNLEDRGLVLINGINKDRSGDSTNGIGKSTLYLSILYALYGELPDGSKGDSIVREDAGKNCYVKLYFSVKGHDYRIERYRKDKENKNKVLLFKGDKDISEPTNKSTDEKILTLIQLTSTTMYNTLVFTSDGISEFSNAADKDRKDILENLTNTSIYKKSLDLVKNDLKDVKERKQNIEKDLDRVNVSRKEMESLLFSYEEAVKAQKVQKANLESNIKSLTMEISNNAIPTEENLDELRQESSKLEQDINKISVKDANPLYSKLLEVRNSYKNAVKSMQDINDKIADYRRQYTDLKNSPDNICRVCGNVLDEEHKKKELDRLVSEGSTCKITLEQSQKEIEVLKNEGISLNEEYTKMQSKNNELTKALDEKEQKLSNLTREINSIQNNLMQYKMKVTRIDTLKESLSNISEISKPNISMSDSDKKIKELSDKKDKLDKDIADREKLLVVFGNQGVKAHVLGLIIPYINSKMDLYLDKLTEGTMGAHLIGQTEAKNGNVSDKLDIVIDSSATGSVYKELSSGEKKRISIALNLSFMSYLTNRVSDTNIAIYDEALDALDNQGVEAVLSLLKEESKNIGTIMVISHNSSLKFNDNFDEVLNLEKSNGISTLY